MGRRTKWQNARLKNLDSALSSQCIEGERKQRFRPLHNLHQNFDEVEFSVAEAHLNRLHSIKLKNL